MSDPINWNLAPAPWCNPEMMANWFSKENQMYRQMYGGCSDCNAGPDDECESGCGVSKESDRLDGIRTDENGRRWIVSDQRGMGTTGEDAGGAWSYSDVSGYGIRHPASESAADIMKRWEQVKAFYADDAVRQFTASEVRDIDTASRIIDQCDEIKQMLLDKNRAYGDSALKPINLFAKGVAAQQLSVRIDDKLSRIQRGDEYPGDDTILDLIGYLVLYRIARQKEGK